MKDIGYDSKRHRYNPMITWGSVRAHTFKNENDVKRAVKTILDLYLHCMHWSGAASAMSGTQTVDRHAVMNGIAIAIEVKYKKNRPTAPQSKFLSDIERAGGLAICVRESNLDLLLESLEYVSVTSHPRVQIDDLGLNLTDRCRTAHTYRDTSEYFR